MQETKRTIKVNVLYCVIQDKYGGLHLANNDGLQSEDVIRDVIKKLSKRIQGPCHVYLIRNPDNGLHKIGIADDVERRLKQLQNDTGSVLQVVASGKLDDRDIAFGIEARFHRALCDFRKHGEWFDLSADIVAWVADVLSLPSKNMAWPIIGHEPDFGGFKRKYLIIKDEWRTA